MDRGDAGLADPVLEALPDPGNDQPARPDLHTYDRYVVMFSGGKDSLACVLHLLECGVDPRLIELHHHLVDGREGSKLMDWACTESYCEAVAKALGVSISFSWRIGGLERELLRQDSPTAPAMVPGDDGEMIMVGGSGPKGTRRKFPQVSASLSVRWCSPSAKIDVGARWLTNAAKFREGRTLVITGERAQESTARAGYATFEPHRCDLRDGLKVQRHIDHWRAVHSWSVEEVWAIIERFSVQVHPAYWLGFGRCSCLCCVFGGRDQWATVRVISPKQFAAVSSYEREFGITIHRQKTVEELADAGTPWSTDPVWIEIANSSEFNLPIFMLDWKAPPGAWVEGCGPP